MTSYKSKIYTTLGTPTNIEGNVVSVNNSSGVPAKDYTIKGKTIVWNQLFTNLTTSSNGVTISQNQDGTMTLNGTTNKSYINFTILSDVMNQVHKYLLCLKILSNPGNVAFYYGWLNRYKMNTDVISNGESCVICNQTESLTQIGRDTGLAGFAAGAIFNNVKIAVMVMDLTQMFGAGNEPATPAEFRAMFPDDYYPYNAGELKTIVPTSVESKNQSGETIFVNIPSSKYFPDGMRSAGLAYDEINFLSQKAIKRVGVRAYQTGDENDANVMTDKINTVYILSTPVETTITPPLQALSTFNGFTSFSAPNSLTQNGPLSVTYYAEGGTNPESGWLMSYKRKLYMGRTIEWNQLFTNLTTSSNGVTISQNQDGTMTLNGTANKSYVNFTPLSDAMNQVHKYLLCLKILNNPDNVSFYYGWLNRYAMKTGIISNGESCVVCNQTESFTQMEKSTGLVMSAAGTVFNNVKIAVMVMDLTQMFGAGNEPTTPEEFWSYFDHKLYPYKAGETQLLFKISRKRLIK